MFIKKISSDGNIASMVRNVNFNFDMLYQQSLLNSNINNNQVINNIIPGINGTKLVSATDLHNLQNISDNDFVLVTNDHTFNNVEYVVGDLLNITISNNIISNITTVLNIKGDKGDKGEDATISNGILTIENDNFNNPKVISNFNKVHNTTFPLILGTTNISANTNTLLDNIYNNNEDNTSLYIYGDSMFTNSGKLVFLYNDDSTPVPEEEYITAPFIKGITNDGMLSMLLQTQHDLKLAFQDNFNITNGTKHFANITNTKTSFINDVFTFSDVTTNFLTIKNGNIGLHISDPQYDISVDSNITFESTSTIKVLNNDDQILLKGDGSLKFKSHVSDNLTLSNPTLGNYNINFLEGGSLKGGLNSGQTTRNINITGGDVNLSEFEGMNLFNIIIPNNPLSAGNIHISGGNGDYYPNVFYDPSGSSTPINGAYINTAYCNSGNVYIHGGVTPYHGDVYLANSGTINSIGSVIVGDAVKNGILNVGGLLSVQNKSTSPIINAMEITVPSTAVSGKLIRFKKDAMEIGSISMTGPTVVYNTTSDSRLKNKIHIANSNDFIDKINKIKIWKFNWKNNIDIEEYGVMAQELVEIIPEVVTKPLDDSSYYQVSYQKLIPVLVSGMQELIKITDKSNNNIADEFNTAIRRIDSSINKMTDLIQKNIKDTTILSNDILELKTKLGTHDTGMTKFNELTKAFKGIIDILK